MSFDIAALAQQLLDAGVVRFGSFTLKDGRQSPVYFDLRVLIARPALLKRIAAAMVERARAIPHDCLAGLPYAGLPIAVAMSIAGDTPLVYPRKEAKDYGTKKRVEGIFSPGARALVIDDVITTGGAKLEALAPLREAGLSVQDILVVIDREQADLDSLRNAGLRLHSLARVSDLLTELERAGSVSPTDIARARAFLQTH
ncbi:MAG TPA: orotate phosphoribosyltransferase [Terriglobales bacterium]|nr:orotate phosphoribosyltransferase [Terriglobales bacterium]